MTFKTALIYIGIAVAALVIADIAKPAINKMLGR